MNKNDELVIILKKIVHCENYVEYRPIEVTEGYYDKENHIFFDKTGTPYKSIIEAQGSHGYYNRQSIEAYKKQYPNLPLSLIKALQLHYAKEVFFRLSIEGSTKDNAPIILINKKHSTQTPKLALDKDIINFYVEKYPNMATKLFEEFGIDIKSENIPHAVNQKEEEKELNIDQMYNELTENVINQEEPIKQILVAIWKQYNGFSDKKTRNILINGSTGVGKTQIFRILTKLLKIPHFITSATDYSATGYVGKSAEDMLINILKNANYDLEKAQQGILVIDEIDKLSESNNKNSQINQRDVQEAILKILEDAIIPITINHKEYMFDTSQLMVIGLGSWSRIVAKEKRAIGFAGKEELEKTKNITKDDMVNNGMIAELIGRFPIVVHMNELEYEHLLMILKSKNSILQTNTKFFEAKGIDLILEEDTQKEIAKKASKQKYGARSLDEIIETALSVASFEIAKNPNIYSKLIITPETIEDNKKFTLIRKKES